MYSDEHLYYDDFEVGQVWETPGRTVSAADIQAFAELTGDFNPIHVDPEYAATTPFGRVIAHGLLTLSIASGATVNQPRVRTLAVVELKSIKFTAPVYPDDVISVRTTVMHKERRGRGKRGLVTWLREIINQDGKIVQEGQTITLVEARDFPPPK